jgi:uncharacterized protein
VNAIAERYPRGVDLPVFPLHAVLFPGMRTTLRVFESRYLALLDDILPTGPFVIAAIAHGAEVGGPATPYRVGVVVGIDHHQANDDGSWQLGVLARDRVALIEPASTDRPYQRWRVSPYPDEGGAGTDDVESAAEALKAYLAATGDDARPIVPREPVTASWALAAAVPGLPAVRQALLEVPGAGERLARIQDAFRSETRLVRALGAGVGGADPVVNPN